MNSISPTMASDATSIYLYFDKGGILLYVGITSRGISRNVEHNRSKDWWQYVARQEVVHLPTREQALSSERELILLHRPPFNTQHNPDHKVMRSAYLELATTGRLPTIKAAVLARKYIPLVRIGGLAGLMYTTPPEYAQLVTLLDRDLYGLKCGGKRGRVRVAREGRALMVSITGESVVVDKPHLRVAPYGKGAFTIQAIDLIGDGKNKTYERSATRRLSQRNPLEMAFFKEDPHGVR
jgi:predicted GIY-YIG superfamily endonuclease